MVDVGDEGSLDAVNTHHDHGATTTSQVNDGDANSDILSEAARDSDHNGDEVVNWDEPLEGNEDAESEDEDLEEGETFDYRVSNVPAFSVDAADILRLPHGLKIVITPWNGEAAQDGAHIAMRFRRGPKGLISNSKLVKWSDGSLTLQVGNEVFPVVKSDFDGDNWLGVTPDAEHILLQSKLRHRYTAHTAGEAQALRLVHIREEKTQRQAQLEERIIDPENDELAPSKVKGSKASSSKRGRVASSKRFASNLTPGDLDGRYKLDDEEDLSAVVKSFRKNKSLPPQSRAQSRPAVEFSSPSSEYSSAQSSISGDDDEAKFKGRRRVVDDSDSS